MTSYIMLTEMQDDRHLVEGKRSFWTRTHRIIYEE